MSFYSLSRYSDTIMPLLPLFVLVLKNKWHSGKYLFIFLLLITYFTLNGIANILGDQKINNQWIYHLYIIITFLFLTLFFIQIIQNQKFRSIAWGIFGCFLIFSFLNIILWQDLKSFDSNGFGLVTIILIVYCIIFYYERLKYTDTVFIEKLPGFWIVSGFFFYYAVCFFLFVVYVQVAKYQLTFFHMAYEDVWIFHQIMFIVQNIFISIGLLCIHNNQSRVLPFL